MPANTLESRNALLAKQEKLSKQLYGPASDNMTGLQMRRLQAEREALQREYRDTLPQVIVGRCPFTDEPVTDRIDLFGFDGPFWDAMFEEAQPAGGSTFLFYQGAVNFHGERPDQIEAGENQRIILGPEVPFVIPDLLSRKECRCSVSSIQLLGGKVTVYFIAYFARPRIPTSDLHANWLRDSFMYLNQKSEKTIKVSNEAWDFDLAGWANKVEKLYWADPGDSQCKLQTGTADDCPYVGLSGERRPQEISAGQLIFTPLPSGEPVTPDEIFD